MSSEYDVSPFADTWSISSPQAEYIPPIDISQITSREIYDEVVKAHLRGKRYRLWVGALVLDLLVDRKVSIPALSVLFCLGQQVGYNTMVYTDTKTLTEGTGCVRQTISTSIAELKEMGLVREVDHKLVGKGDRFFLLNPLYFFLGYYPHRDSLIQAWFKPSVSRFDDSQISE